VGSNEDPRRQSSGSYSSTARLDSGPQGRILRKTPSNKEIQGVGSLVGEAPWTMNSDVTNASQGVNSNGSSLAAPPPGSAAAPDREAEGGTTLVRTLEEATTAPGPSGRRGSGSLSMWSAVGISRLMDSSGISSASSKDALSGSNSVMRQVSPRVMPDRAARAASPSRAGSPQGTEQALMAQMPLQQLQQLREEFRAECQAQVQMLRRVEEILRGELQTCREDVLDAVKAEAAERLESAARMEKDWRTSLKEEATVRRAVATHLETRLGEFAATIETVRAELQKATESRYSEVMPTLQESPNEEHLARLDEALEREALARQELEKSLSSRFEVVAHQLFTRCQREHQAQQSPEEERPKALDSESGRRVGPGTESLARRQPSEDGGSVSSIFDGAWRGQVRTGATRMHSSSTNAAQNQQPQPQQQQQQQTQQHQHQQPWPAQLSPTAAWGSSTPPSPQVNPHLDPATITRALT